MRTLVRWRAAVLPISKASLPRLFTFSVFVSGRLELQLNLCLLQSPRRSRIRTLLTGGWIWERVQCNVQRDCKYAHAVCVYWERSCCCVRPSRLGSGGFGWSAGVFGAAYVVSIRPDILISSPKPWHTARGRDSDESCAPGALGLKPRNVLPFDLCQIKVSVFIKVAIV